MMIIMMMMIMLMMMMMGIMMTVMTVRDYSTSAEGYQLILSMIFAHNSSYLFLHPHFPF